MRLGRRRLLGLVNYPTSVNNELMDGCKPAVDIFWRVDCCESRNVVPVTLVEVAEFLLVLLQMGKRVTGGNDCDHRFILLVSEEPTLTFATLDRGEASSPCCDGSGLCSQRYLRPVV